MKYISFAAFLIILMIQPILGQGEGSASRGTVVGQGTDSKELYNQARYLLRKGRAFETAIGQMKQAVIQTPESSLYRSALGCALTGRAVSVAFATGNIGRYQQDRKLHEKLYADWQAATRSDIKAKRNEALTEPPRETPATPLRTANGVEVTLTPEQEEKEEKLVILRVEWAKEYAKNRFSPDSPPPAPPQLCTRDDSKPFRLTEEEGTIAFSRLSKEALGALETSVKQATKEEKAERLWIQACCLRLLGQSAEALKISPLVAESETLHGFEQAIALSPENPSYWRSQGDFYVKEGVAHASREARSKALDSYRAALQHGRNDTATWMQIYDILRAQRTESAEATDALRGICRRDASNAYPRYHLASLLLMDQQRLDAPPVQEAICLITEANNAAAYRPIEYPEAVPPLLVRVWPYVNEDLRNSRSWPLAWGNMAQTIQKLAQNAVSSSRENKAMALRALQTLPGIARQMKKTSLADDARWNSRQQGCDLIAYDVLNQAYQGMILVYQATGDVEGEQQWREEQKAALAPYRERQKAALQAALYEYGRY